MYNIFNSTYKLNLKLLSFISLLIILSVSVFSFALTNNNPTKANATSCYYNYPGCENDNVNSNNINNNNYYNNSGYSYYNNNNSNYQNRTSRFNLNRCYISDSNIMQSQDGTFWCGRFINNGCTIFYKAISELNGLCSTGGDTSFDKNDIRAYRDGSLSCEPGFKLYYYTRQQGGSNGNGPIICAFYPDQDRNELRWYPRNYTSIEQLQY
jgi:hypothetical protein